MCAVCKKIATIGHSVTQLAHTVEGLGWELLEARRLRARTGLLEKVGSDLFQSDAAEIISTLLCIFKSENATKFERYIAEHTDT
jgi:hypothetical protein